MGSNGENVKNKRAFFSPQKINTDLVRKISEENKKVKLQRVFRGKNVVVIAERKRCQQHCLTWDALVYPQYDEESKETAFDFSFEVSSAPILPHRWVWGDLSSPSRISDAGPGAAVGQGSLGRREFPRRKD